IVVLASMRSFTYARRWNDRLNFYRQSLAEQPMSAQLYMLTAGEYSRLGQHIAAEAVIARAVEVFPDSWHVWARRAINAMVQQPPRKMLPRRRRRIAGHQHKALTNRLADLLQRRSAFHQPSPRRVPRQRQWEFGQHPGIKSLLQFWRRIGYPMPEPTTRLGQS